MWCRKAVIAAALIGTASTTRASEVHDLRLSLPPSGRVRLDLRMAAATLVLMSAPS
jgi:hypothetical protein